MCERAQILQTDEGKKIIELIDSLTPWDKIDLIESLAFDFLEIERFNERLKERFGIEDDANDDSAWESDNPVDLVRQEGLEEEVLDAMSDRELAAYIAGRNMLPTLVHNLTWTERLNFIRGLDTDFLKDFLKDVIDLRVSAL